ncbi:MAG: DUF488 family protein [Verrucomicrobiae bacterium]|nr:DUF488 family protein [Verrucomicrobiae bacterium]
MSSEDGIRILVTRFRGRGMRKSRYDLWLPSLGPSEDLLASFAEIGWSEFSRRYREELWLDGEVDERNHSSKNHGQKGLMRTLRFLSRRQRVTLMCHCDEDAEHCHRHLLKRMILSSKVTL